VVNCESRLQSNFMATTKLSPENLTLGADQKFEVSKTVVHGIIVFVKKLCGDFVHCCRHRERNNAAPGRPFRRQLLLSASRTHVIISSQWDLDNTVDRQTAGLYAAHPSD